MAPLRTASKKAQRRLQEVANNLIGVAPLTGAEKEAHESYRVGLNAQTSGDLALAVRSTLGFMFSHVFTT